MKSCIALLITIILIGCDLGIKNTKKQILTHNDTTKLKTKFSFDTTINIGYGFEVSCKEDIFSDDSSSPTYLTIKYNNRQIYSENSREDYYYYVFNDSLNPTIISFGNELYELFLELDNRPNKETLKMLKIQSGKVVDSAMFPTFCAKQSHLFNDKRLVFAGIWDYGEEWTDSSNNEFITYNPILYYEVGNSGLVLDSAETIERNKKIYGKFYGFGYDEHPRISAKRGDVLAREFKKISTRK